MRTYLIQIGLFILSFITTTLAGAELTSGKYWLDFGMGSPADQLLKLEDFWLGLPYSLSFLTFLSFHEFGHYFAAVYHKVRSSLPYYIPIFIPIPGILNIGSFGAVIRLKEIPTSTRKFFDIGIAGPLAGFVVSIFLLLYGFMNLPPMESYVMEIEPFYEEQFGFVPEESIIIAALEAEENYYGYYVGTNLLFELLKAIVPQDPAQVPNHFDLIHYPFLFVGYITLFFTALNLLPMGQLDGGHVVYGMFGQKKAGQVARVALIGLLFFGGTGIMEFRGIGVWDFVSIGVYILFLVYIFSKVLGRNNWQLIVYSTLLVLAVQIILKWNFPTIQFNFIWLLYAWMVVRFIGLDHPRAFIEHKVNASRQFYGYLAILIFILCFTPTPLSVVGA
ncbi:MAG: site-2 protease family protein [Bacteroidota bacterium]